MLAISTMNISAGQTVANLVTVYATISFQNNSQGTLQVVADLDGYYSNAGSGFQPVAPVRVLDTRNKIGTMAAGPVAARGTVRLNLSGHAAGVLNITVTEPKAAGFLTAYPANGKAPNSSNVNFLADQTIANLVTVQVSAGQVAIYNGSSGSVQIIVDQEGYYIDQP